MAKDLGRPGVAPQGIEYSHPMTTRKQLYVKVNWNNFYLYTIIMRRSFHDMQQEVDYYISQTPNGYHSVQNIKEDIQQKIREIETAECEYIWSKSILSKRPQQEEKLKNLKTKIGNFLFAVCCLANATWTNLQASFETAIDVSIQQAIPDKQELLYKRYDRQYGDLLRLICNFVNTFDITLEESFSLAMEKRAKNNNQKEDTP